MDRAASLVKVMTKISSGGTFFSSIRYKIRLVMVKVLPLPGPANKSKGPVSCKTACFWASFKPVRSNTF